LIDWLESNGEKEHNMLAHIASIQANKKKATVRHGRMASHQASTQKQKKKKKKERKKGTRVRGLQVVDTFQAGQHQCMTDKQKTKEEER